jgi:hypothetical protein
VNVKVPGPVPPLPRVIQEVFVTAVQEQLLEVSGPIVTVKVPPAAGIGVLPLVPSKAVGDGLIPH